MNDPLVLRRISYAFLGLAFGLFLFAIYHKVAERVIDRNFQLVAFASLLVGALARRQANKVERGE